MPLQVVTEDIWVVHRPLRFFGIEVGTRMTVIRLADGTLWIHSPVRIDESLARQIEALGEVRHIVAPNRFHHLFAGEAHQRFPGARLHVAPGLPEKRPDLGAGEVLGDDPDGGWESEIVVHRVAGLRILGEVVFFHPRSRSLIVSDLVFNFGPDDPWMTRQFGRLIGTYGRLGCPLDLRLLFLADRVAFSESIAVIRGWAFEQIVLAHGDIVTEDARASFERAFAFLGAAAIRPDAG